MIRTILFDLDGTLLDTAPDLANALNLLLQEQGQPPLPYEKIRPVVSHGGRALINLGFNVDIGDTSFASLRQRLLDLYQDNIATHTSLFPGMEEVLAFIESQGMQWGVVTNKPGYLTDPLMKALNLYERAACIVSGDTTANNKPHAEPMLLACKLCNSEINECIYIGDAARDIEAGKNAGMITLSALYGYLMEGEDGLDWGADTSIEQPTDIIDWIKISSSLCLN